MESWCSAQGWCATLVQATSPSAAGGWSAFYQLALLWVLGAFMGWLLPRPKVVQTGWFAQASSFFSSATPWRRLFLAWHGAIIMREVWFHFTSPGTFRRLAKAAGDVLKGRGSNQECPTASQAGGAAAQGLEAASEKAPSRQDNWYVSNKDFEFFKSSIDAEGPDKPLQQQRASGAGPWEQMMDREIPGVVKYTAWRRTLANGKTEYRSVTHCPDATAEEFMDMYFDDDNRPNWDTMIIRNEALEHGDFAQRQQVVRWVRRFPFSFISDREYVIAKRMFREGQDMYGITKSIDHPRAPVQGDLVRMDVFYSMWRSRTVPCPWNSGQPACETTLLHHEQMKVPENLSRFAVKHGMWGFVRKLSSETPKFIEARRQRCDPYQPDQQAYGAGFKPNPPQPTEAALGRARGSTAQLSGGGADACAAGSTPTKLVSGAAMRRTDTSTSVLSSLTTASSMERGGSVGGGLVMMAVAEGGASDLDAMRRGNTAATTGGGAMPRTKSVSGKVRGLAAFALASGLAILLQRSTSSERLPGLTSSASVGGAAGSRKSLPGGGAAGSSSATRRMRRARTQTYLPQDGVESMS